MSQLIIPSAGALLGSYFGPTGSSIGWAIGSMLSAQDETIAVDNTTQIGDLRVQTSEYGVPIPTVIGKQRVAGNVIWAEEKVPHVATTDSGGSKGSPVVTTSTTSYTISLAILLCKGTILGVDKIWADGKLIIDSTSSVEKLIGTLYLGTDTQNPDSYMEGKLGAGNVPAYRGLSYMVLKDVDLGASGRIPNFTFRVLKEGLI